MRKKTKVMWVGNATILNDHIDEIGTNGKSIDRITVIVILEFKLMNHCPMISI